MNNGDVIESSHSLHPLLTAYWIDIWFEKEYDERGLLITTKDAYDMFERETGTTYCKNGGFTIADVDKLMHWRMSR